MNNKPTNKHAEKENITKGEPALVLVAKCSQSHVNRSYVVAGANERRLYSQAMSIEYENVSFTK